MFEDQNLQNTTTENLIIVVGVMVLFLTGLIFIVGPFYIIYKMIDFCCNKTNNHFKNI